MAKIAAPTYLTAIQVLDYVRRGTPTLVIDVRESDREGGHIKGSKHIPAPTFRSNPSKYLHLAGGKERIVFHCMFSQYRGPSCANSFIEAWNERAETDKSYSDTTAPEVCVMAGGFNAAAKIVRTNADVIEAFKTQFHQ